MIGLINREENRTEESINEWLLQLSESFGFNFDIINMSDLEKSRVLVSSGIYEILSDAEIAHLKKIKLEKNRLQWIAGRYAVKNAFRKHMHLRAKRDFGTIDVLKGADSAPYILQYQSCTASITHSYPYCVGVVADKRIGVDIENIFMPDKSLIKYFYTDNEKHVLKNCIHKDEYSWMAMAYWTRKEAISKLFRLGMNMDFSKLDTTYDYYYKNDMSIRLKSFRCRDFCISIAVELSNV
ncbi:4'-phosphopantetheinyl transferase family protein [Pseudobacteroides cellulosolvens]|uniref:4'-phosphopantetheinyl transferase n=1 Tax=Pseudobacteroides cellulosolvens ATCC 35603 = DSM 2933 TaxID=398512 RepID=A0A0L6JMH7_9FIRM|nr:4'-phosphopantetheinyl transferase superfamily protein [Pseudobacteroides cellulosolvens]KNY26963.1 4'-phosphopantetheinyl transferase [Pseudobacteroides cellulosolvens ATCC 35603 = DSM 2933]